MNVDKQFIATKAFIQHQGKILILKESTKYKDGTNHGRYDVVGGRVEKGERFDESLLREIKEETGLKVIIKDPFFVSEWRPKPNGESWQVVGIFFKCEAKSENVKLSQDHESYEWINPEEYKNYNLVDNVRKAFEKYLEKRIDLISN